MKLYISDLSIYVLIIFYLPLVLWILWRTLKKPLPIIQKIGMALLMLVVAYAIPLGDVTVNSVAMAKACPTAGLHIYKTVEVEGYLTDNGDGDILKKSPYKFIETPQLKTDDTYFWIHYGKQPDGTISREQLDQPKAEYEVRRGDGHYDQATRTEKASWVIRNRITGEITAEWSFFRALPGWVDRILVYRWFGSGGSMLSCINRSDFSSWEQKVLRPKQLIK